MWTSGLQSRLHPTIIFDLDGVLVETKIIHFNALNAALKKYENYLEICQEIKNACFKNLNIIENRSRTIMYGRTELSRKKLLNVDTIFLERHGIEVFHFSKLSFSEMVKIMAIDV